MSAASIGNQPPCGNAARTPQARDVASPGHGHQAVDGLQGTLWSPPGPYRLGQTMVAYSGENVSKNLVPADVVTKVLYPFIVVALVFISMLLLTASIPELDWRQAR
jgi:hypothetical protein